MKSTRRSRTAQKAKKSFVWIVVCTKRESYMVSPDIFAWVFDNESAAKRKGEAFNKEWGPLYVVDYHIDRRVVRSA